MVQRDEHDTLPPSQDPHVAEGVEAPPNTWLGILGRLGPGLIIAGSIVGSGELIATTKTGAQAGIALLWLIVIGCLIKVFVQIELGRYAITHGETTLSSLDQLPGPRIGPNWVIWLWIVMMLCTIGQLGGIVGGVGQSLAITFPMSGDYVDAIRMPSAAELQQYDTWDDEFLSPFDYTVLTRELDDESGRRSTDISTDDPWFADTVSHSLALIEEAGDGFAIGAVSRGTQEEQLEEFRQECNRFNLARVRAAKSNEPDEEKSPLEKLADADSGRQERVVRGHGLLAVKMVVLDDLWASDSEGTTEQDRPIRALLAARALKRAKDDLKALEEDLATTETAGDLDATREARQRIGLAEAEVEYRQDRADVLIEPFTLDDKYWAAIVAVLTAGVLYVGRYNAIQTISLVLVVSFTFITLGNVISLQFSEVFHIPFRDIVRGLSFGAPETVGGKNPWVTAIATFGIIGVGATELVAYPYWCLEKGYGKWTGVRTNEDSWAARARGWMRVMRVDAFASMIVYTIATVAFYFMGVAVLFEEGRDPDGMRMVSTLAQAYVPVFGVYAKWLFLVGAIAVLYSTFLVANAANARMVTDCLKVVGVLPKDDERSHTKWVGLFSIALPLMCLAVFCSGANPVTLVLIAGTMQFFFLPILAFAAIWFRLTATDPRLKPTPLWDVMLILSSAALLLAGVYGMWSKFA